MSRMHAMCTASHHAKHPFAREDVPSVDQAIEHLGCRFDYILLIITQLIYNHVINILPSVMCFFLPNGGSVSRIKSIAYS